MTTEIKTPETAQPTSTLPSPEQEQKFDWRQCWYPVNFVQDLPKNRPYTFSLYDEPFVLFRNQDGKLICLTDRCSHRAAKLSDGQIIDGKIECLYHGWQFGANGECLHIPQLPTDAKIPLKACVQSFTVVERQDMIWVWPGEAETADDRRIPTIPNLGKPGFVHTDKISDLPYDQSYFIENVLDPAHVHISHNGSQGKRELAQPLEMEIIDSSIDGFQGRFRETRQPDRPWRNLDFIAPNLVFLRFTIEERNWSFGLILYSIPLGKNRCRVLTRSYRNFFTWQVKFTPRWFIHLGQSKILDEDMELVIGQKNEIARSGKSLKEMYLPIKTSDTFVMEYRKWLDKFGSALPFYQGYATSKGIEPSETDRDRSVELNRLVRHTQLCSSCARTYQTTKKMKQALVLVAIVMAAFAIITDGSKLQIVAVSTSLLTVALALLADNLKTKFERSYTRH